MYVSDVEDRRLGNHTDTLTQYQSHYISVSHPVTKFSKGFLGIKIDDLRLEQNIKSMTEVFTRHKCIWYGKPIKRSCFNNDVQSIDGREQNTKGTKIKCKDNSWLDWGDWSL